MPITPDPDQIQRARNPDRGPDGRLLSLRDAVEVSIFRPGPAAARGPHRDELVRRRDATVAELATVDAELATLVGRRRDLVDRIQACNLAIAGTGEIRDPETGETLQRMRNWRRHIPFDDPQPTVGEDDGDDEDDEAVSVVSVVSGAPLRSAVLELLGAVGGPMSPAEIERLLRLQHLVPAGRPSQAIVNALRPALRRGQVTVVERGWYEIAT
ncbi:MAG: hypothetical protein ACXV5S_02385 [Acidimicrobiales bacterium]